MISVSDTRWWTTLDVSERSKLSGEPIPCTENDEVWQMWQKLTIFRRDDIDTEESLHPFNLTIPQLKALATEGESSLYSRAENTISVPSWVKTLIRWWNSPKLASEHGDKGFLNIIEHVVECAIVDLRAAACEIDNGMIEQSKLIELITTTVPLNQLVQIVTPTLVLIKTRDYKQIKMSDFYHSLTLEDTRVTVLKEFPVLWRLVTVCLNDWISSILKFYGRLLNDSKKISSIFEIDINKIDGVEAHVGDPHNRGASVIVVKCKDKRCVYKPRLATGEQLLANAIRLLNFQTTSVPCQAKIIDMDSYFWQEYIESTPIKHGDLETVAKKLGVLNAVLYALQAEDMHHENIAIQGDRVAAIDCECIPHTIRPIDFESIPAENPAAILLAKGAHSLGIVPQPIVGNKEGSSTTADISVFGYEPGTTLGLKVPKLELSDAGQASITMDDAVFSDADPVKNRKELLTQVSAFINSFESALRLIVSRKQEFVELLHRGPTKARLIARPTMIYAKVLTESYHPTFLRSGILRDICLSKLLPHYYDKPYRTWLIAQEIKSLRDGYIPYLTIEISSGTLRMCNSEHSIDAIPRQELSSHIMNLDERSVGMQRYLLELAFASRTNRGNSRLVCCQYEQNDDVYAMRLMAASILGSWVLEHSFIRKGMIGSPIMNAVTPNQWIIGSSGLDLYNGLFGLQLMIEQLYDACPTTSLVSSRNIIRNTVDEFSSLISISPDSVRKNLDSLNVGAFDQIAGIALSMLLIDQKDNTLKYRDRLSTALQLLEIMTAEDENYDVISGSAGALIVGNLASSVVPDDASRLMNTAVDRLLAGATDIGQDKVAWKCPGELNPLVGLSHGASGIAAALSRTVNGHRKAEEIVEVIEKALRWERQYFTKQTGWTDLRADPGEQKMQAWCHGAAGAAISRVQILNNCGLQMSQELLDQTRLEINIATKLLLAETKRMLRAKHSDCLCHGTVGNILVLEFLSSNCAANTEDFHVDIQELWHDLLLSRGSHGWRSGGLPGTNLMGFMMGLSGIAWGLSYFKNSISKDFSPLWF